jgi:sulfite reductase beta subunit-like hemoprotein
VLADAATALCLVFLDARRGQESRIRRMRDLVAARGTEAIGRAANLDQLGSHHFHPRSALPERDRTEAKTSHTPPPIVIVGLDPRISHGRCRADGVAANAGSEHDDARDAPQAVAFLGVGLPFGRMVAEDLAQLASAVAWAGGRELRLTPWRAILVAVPSVQAARALSTGLASHAFIFNPDDPRRRIAACPGAPSCECGTTRVRDDAASLAATIAAMPGNGTVLHVSGCEKGCAHPRKAAVTLVARCGRYDLILNGSASDVPAMQGLTQDQAADQIRRFAEDRAGDQLRQTANQAPGAPA